MGDTIEITLPAKSEGFGPDDLYFLLLALPSPLFDTDNVTFILDDDGSEHGFKNVPGTDLTPFAFCQIDHVTNERDRYLSYCAVAFCLDDRAYVLVSENGEELQLGREQPSGSLLSWFYRDVKPENLTTWFGGVEALVRAAARISTVISKTDSRFLDAMLDKLGKIEVIRPVVTTT